MQPERRREGRYQISENEIQLDPAQRSSEKVPPRTTKPPLELKWCAENDANLSKLDTSRILANKSEGEQWD